MEVSVFQKNERPPKWAYFSFSIPSNPRQMILNMHSPYIGFEEVSACQDYGLETKAKYRWKWLWRMGPNSLNKGYWGTKLVGWRLQTVTGEESYRAGYGVPGKDLFLHSYKSVLIHACLRGPLLPKSSYWTCQFKETSSPKVGRQVYCFLHDGSDPPPLTLPRQQEDETVTTLSSSWSIK